MTAGQAVRDTSTALGRMAAECQSQREEIIAQWMTLGYSREEAYRAALFGYRK